MDQLQQSFENGQQDFIIRMLRSSSKMLPSGQIIILSHQAQYYTLILPFSPSDDHKSKKYLDHCICRATILLGRVAAQRPRSVAQARSAAQTRRITTARGGQTAAVRPTAASRHPVLAVSAAARMSPVVKQFSPSSLSLQTQLILTF